MNVKLGKVPTKVTTLDFTSMYPTVTMLLDLWKFIIAEDIETKEVTEEIKVLLRNNRTYLICKNKEHWKDFIVMVKAKT